MAAEETDDTFERDQVWRWRISEFQRLGFNRRQRTALANDEVSPHDAAVLIANGCPVETAFDILS